MLQGVAFESAVVENIYNILNDFLKNIFRGKSAQASITVERGVIMMRAITHDLRETAGQALVMIVFISYEE